MTRFDVYALPLSSPNVPVIELKPSPDLKKSLKSSVSRRGISLSDRRPKMRPTPGFASRMRPSATYSVIAPVWSFAIANDDGGPGQIASMSAVVCPPSMMPG